NGARFDAAVGARDAGAFAWLFADSVEIVEHPTGVIYDREGALRSMSIVMKARDPAARNEPLAALGDSPALVPRTIAAKGFTGSNFDVDLYQRETIALIEVDANGRRRRSEHFAVDRLGDAVARLYARYAELLPDGPERARAAATARSSAAVLGGAFDP